MIANPKKLRPYDEPPKRRRGLIPDWPGSAATGFLVVATLWLALAGGIGLLAVGLRIFPNVSLSLPLIGDAKFQVDAGRAQLAFLNAVVYGWLTNAGIAAIFFITSRLTGRRLFMEKMAMLGLLFLNVGVLAGIAWIYIANLGPATGLSAFAAPVNGLMLLGVLLAAGAFFGTEGDPTRGSRYISSWYFAIALLALLGLLAGNVVLGVLDLPEKTEALASLFAERALEAYWLLGVALGTLYYVIPREAENPLYSTGVALLGWATWLLLAGPSALAPLVDPSVPYFVTTLGIVTTLLMLVPAFLVVANLVLTVRGRWSLLLSAGALPFAIVSLAFLLGTALLQGIGALRAVQVLVDHTEWINGAFIYATLGAYTFAMLSFAEYSLPRLLRREWGGGFLSGAELWTGFAGATIAGLALIGGGLAQGSLLTQSAAPDQIDATLLPFRVAAAGGLGLWALAGLALLVSLFLMYTSARSAQYVLPQTPTILPAVADA
ncbi:MAG: cbb3-type cytochrome c oxidase subunit I [Chloroflexota bacterium]|nr:cbb3-type cytochrome c oxidase subunit I [Chloroflexota bacterium]